MNDTTIESGLVCSADGRIAPLPHDITGSISHELLQVMTLLRCARGEADECGTSDEEDDGLTSRSSRAVALIRMAEEKVRGALHVMEPYV